MKSSIKTILSRLLWVSAFLIICYLGVTGWIYFNQNNLMYNPNKNIKEIQEYNLAGTEDLLVKSEDGSLIQIWFHKPTKDNMPMVVFYPGNSFNLAYRELAFRELLNLGYGFIAPSYHGFGKSEGSPSKEAILSDARTAIKILKEKGYKTEDSILVGESLGSGVATQMATEYPFKGLFLITPYTSIVDVAKEIYWYLPVEQLTKDNFSNYDIDKVNIPLLIVHGTMDNVIPLSHSEKLYALANEPKKIIIYNGKGHSNLDTKEIYNQMTMYFLKSYVVENDKEDRAFN